MASKKLSGFLLKALLSLGMLFSLRSLFAFTEDGAVGFSVGGSFHVASIERRGSQEAKVFLLNTRDHLAFDIRFISIARSGLVSSNPAYGIGASIRYYPIFPDIKAGSEESGFIVGLGAGSYHYMIGNSAYPLDPFFEGVVGFALTASSSFSLLLEANAGLYPYLYNSDYFEEESQTNRLRPRIGVCMTLVFPW